MRFLGVCTALVASVAGAATTPLPPRARVEVPDVIGRPAAAAGEMLGIAHGVVVWVERSTLTLPTPDGLGARIELCQLVAADDVAEHRRAYTVDGTFLDGAGKLGWHDDPDPTPSLGRWHARFREATADGASCAVAIAQLRSQTTFRSPAPTRYELPEDEAGELRHDRQAERFTFLRGPDRDHVVVVVWRGAVPTSYALRTRKGAE